jgi:hypothetical protein
MIGRARASRAVFGPRRHIFPLNAGDTPATTAQLFCDWRVLSV